jgi:hypothetical protein
MSAKSYAIGVFLGRNKIIVACVALALVGYMLWPVPNAVPTEAAYVPEVGSPSDILKKATLAGTKVPDPCDTGAEQRLASAKAAMKAANPDAAFDLLHLCRSTLTGEAKALYGQALTQANAKREKVADAEAKRIRAEKKRNGVSIGMSEQDALDSSWGKPQKINRTTNAYGVSEQWVYGGGYLYFKDGVLTSIQN